MAEFLFYKYYKVDILFSGIGNEGRVDVFSP